MSDAAAPAPATPKAKAPKKKAAPKKPAEHPTFKVMVAAAIAALKERTGSSRVAICKYIMANYKVGDNADKVNRSVKTALKGGVKDGALKQVKGTGASGSFKLGEKKAEKKPKKVVKKAKSPKKAAKKPAAKKAAKSPAKKAKKPAAKKAAKSPAKKAAKKPAAKKAAKTEKR